MNQLAKVFSVIFHPGIIPTWVVGSLLFFAEHDLKITSNERLRWVMLGAFFFFTFLLPFLNVLVLKKMGYISNLEMENRRERTMPYSVGLVYYAGLFYLLSGSDMPLYYKSISISGFLLILSTLLINLRWKISAHMIGVGGATGALMMYSILYQQPVLIFICTSFFVAGLVGFARLFLNKHTPAQVYTGFLAGLIISCFSILISCLILINLTFV